MSWELTIPIDYTGDTAKLPWTAYSDLVKLNENSLGILYERDNYREIVFKQVVWKSE
jgi:sialidase-1